MANRSIQITEQLYDYMIANSVREPEMLAELRAETAKLPMAMMQIAPGAGAVHGPAGAADRRQADRRGRHLHRLQLACHGARAAARTRSITCCDISEEYTAIARNYWAKAGVADSIDLRLGPAAETLQAMLDDGARATSTSPSSTPTRRTTRPTTTWCCRCCGRAACIAIDNVLWGGDVADPEREDEETEAIRRINTESACRRARGCQPGADRRRPDPGEETPLNISLLGADIPAARKCAANSDCRHSP